MQGGQWKEVRQSRILLGISCLHELSLYAVLSLLPHHPPSHSGRPLPLSPSAAHPSLSSSLVSPPLSSQPPLSLLHPLLPLSNMTVANCSAAVSGGGISVLSSTDVINSLAVQACHVSSASASGTGGGMYVQDSSLTMTGSRFGGCWVDDGTGAGAYAGTGGGLSLYNTTSAINNSQFTACTVRC